MEQAASVVFRLEVDTMTPEMVADPAGFLQRMLEEVRDTIPQRLNDTTAVFDHHGQMIGEVHCLLRGENDPAYMPWEARDQVFDQE